MLITRNKSHPLSLSAVAMTYGYGSFWFAVAAKQRCGECRIIWKIRVFGENINASRQDLCSSVYESMSDISIFSLWEVWRWRISRTIQLSPTVWHTSKKLRQGYSSICVGVEGVSHWTTLNGRMVTAARSWTRTTTTTVHLQSAAKPAQRRKQLHSAGGGNSHCYMHGRTISYPKSVIYCICQNCRTISLYRARVKHKEKGKG